MTIRKFNQTIDTNTSILTFNNPKAPPEIKIVYMLDKWERISQISEAFTIVKNINI